MYIIEKAKIYLKYPIIGNFSYDDKFQIIGENKKDDEGYYAVLEMKIETNGPYYRYSNTNNTLVDKHIRINLWLLSLFTMFRFDKYSRFTDYYKNFNIINQSKIEVKNLNCYHDKNLDDFTVDQFYIPNNLKTFYDKYYSLPDDKKTIFENVLYLFNKAIDNQEMGNQTISFILFVMCIETIIDFSEKGNFERCQFCGQPKYSINKKFIYYMKFYIGKNDEESIKLFKKIYIKRSGMAHCGNLLSSDYYYKFDYNIEYFDEDYFLQQNMLLLARIFIINWLCTDSKLKYKVE